MSSGSRAGRRGQCDAHRLGVAGRVHECAGLALLGPALLGAVLLGASDARAAGQASGDGPAGSSSVEATTAAATREGSSRAEVGDAKPGGRASDAVPPGVEWPSPLSTPVTYPEGASGDASVELELVVEPSGTVSAARVLGGVAPFARSAEVAALAWRFVPAHVAGSPIRVRIRFLVRFTQGPAALAAPVTATPGVVRSTASAPESQEPASVLGRGAEAIEITVTGRRREEAPSTSSIGHAEVEQLPGAFGDPFRAIEVLPGVTPMASGLPFFFIRGAPPGNQGYFVDGIRVPVLYHMVLGPGVIHPALIDRVSLHAGGYPARFGRFAGGIIAADTKDPEPEWHGQGSVRAVDAGGFIAGPHPGGSVAVGGRYSYTAMILSLLVPNLELEYWDYQARASQAVSRNGSVTAFVFGSYDRLRSDEDPETVTTNSTEFHRFDLRYRHHFGGRSLGEVAATYGYDRSRGTADQLSLTDHIINVRASVEHAVAADALVRCGIDGQTDDYDVQALYDGEYDADLQRNLVGRRDFVYGAWADIVLRPSRGITVVPGVRADLYASGDESALGVEPRIAATFEVTKDWRLHHAFGVAHQPPSLFVAIPGASINALSDGLQRSVQLSATTEHDLPEGFHLSLTGFEHAYFNATDQASLISFDAGAELESRTQGQAAGIELMLRRDLTRRIGGFVSYTLSRSWRSFDQNRAPAAFDRTHVLQVAGSYDLGRGWRAGSRFAIYSGVPSSPMDDSLRLVSSLRGGMPRTPTFWRVDGRLQKRWAVGSAGEYAALSFEILNATLNEEMVRRECNAFQCDDWTIGPVTLPSIGFEMGF